MLGGMLLLLLTKTNDVEYVTAVTLRYNLKQTGSNGLCQKQCLQSCRLACAFKHMLQRRPRCNSRLDLHKCQSQTAERVEARVLSRQAALAVVFAASSFRDAKLE